MSTQRHIYQQKKFKVKEPLSFIFNSDVKEFQKPTVTEVIKTRENYCHTLPFNEDIITNEEDNNSFQYSLPFEMDKSSDNFYFCFPTQKTDSIMPKVTLNKKLSFPKKINVCNKFSKKKIAGLHKNVNKSPPYNREPNPSKDIPNKSSVIMKFYTKKDVNKIYSNRNKKIKLSFNKNNKCMSTSRKKIFAKKKNSSGKDNYTKIVNKNLYNINKSNIDTNYSTKYENENTKDHLSNFLDSPVNIDASPKYYFFQTQSNFNYRKTINDPINKNKDMKILIINGNGNKTEYSSQKILKTQENIKKTDFQKKNDLIQFQYLGKQLGSKRDKGGVGKTMKNLNYSPKLGHFKSKICKNNRSIEMKINLNSSMDENSKVCVTNNNSNNQLKKIRVNLKKKISHHYNNSIQGQIQKNNVINEEIYSKYDNLSTNRKKNVKLNGFNLCYTKKFVDISKNFDTLDEKDFYTKTNKGSIYQKKCGIDYRRKIINFTGKKFEYKPRIKKSLFNNSENKISSFDYDKKEIITYNILRNNHYNIVANQISISLSKKNQIFGLAN